MMRITLLVAGMALLQAVGAGHMAAQLGRGGQVELGAFGSYTRFDANRINLANEFGAGGRIGLHLNRAFAIEFSGDHTQTIDGIPGRQAGVTRLGGSLLYHLRAGGDHAFYLGAGWERGSYSGARTATEQGAVLILGDRLPVGRRTALRIEGRLSYYPSSNFGAETQRAVNLSANVGLSIFAFGGPMRDADGDGVPDRRDLCPETPRGAIVDRDGCPIDSDGDGVYDGIDQCPDTPFGAIVDERGCPIDSDGDGVYDGIDQCPDTPRGAIVDERGCPIDSDGDGVPDGIDRCPDTPLGAIVDEFGCPIDSDGDGVPDGIDRCPDTPAGAEVDEWGCITDGDEDGDGVPDSIDRCPGTPPGTPVDAVGCPILFQVEEGRARPLILQGVTFASNRATLTDASYSVLDQVAASLLAHPNVRIEIAGHTDGTGPRQHNVNLSLQRAGAVRTYLAQRGVSPDRMVARGYGPDRPVATNATPAGRAQNRRVELHLLDQR